MGTDQDWEDWGARDPYFGVYSNDKFRRKAMTPETREEFFRSGEQHVSRVLADLRKRFGPGFDPASALDFGSGVGRLVVPLARRMSRVVGVDISESMIAEARKNCLQAGQGHVEFVRSDDSLSLVEGSFDLVHSYIVLQHIPWRRGRVILQSMAKKVSPGGCLAVQMLSRCDEPAIVRALVKLRYVFPPANWLRNVWRSRPMREPAMQLHLYDQEVVRQDLDQLGFETTTVDEPWPGTGFTGVIVLAQRRKP